MQDTLMVSCKGEINDCVLPALGFCHLEVTVSRNYTFFPERLIYSQPGLLHSRAESNVGGSQVSRLAPRQSVRMQSIFVRPHQLSLA